MTTIAIGTPLTPAPKSRKSLWKIALVLFITALFGGLVGYASRPAVNSLNEVPLKPCQTCQTCACPKTLGGVGCLCPK